MSYLRVLVCGAAVTPEFRQMHVTDEIAADSFRKLIIESLHTKTTLFNDFMHLLKHA